MNGLLRTSFAFLIASTLFFQSKGHSQEKPGNDQELKTAVLAGGCFWCVESDFEKAPGVRNVVSGYTGGKSRNPNYKNYASRGHREAVLVTYDPKKITFAGVVEYFIKHIDPIDKGGSFVDRGKGYSPAIYVEGDDERDSAQKVIQAIDEMKVYKSKITVPILNRTEFFPAEDYHQDYHNVNAPAYGVYRMKCGRDEFVRKIWGDKADKLILPGSIPDQANAKEGSDKVPRDAAKRDAAMKESNEPDRRWAEYKKPDAATLRSKLSKSSFRVTQSDETEPAFRNEFWNHHEPGIYVDVVSGEPLFASFDKFDSGTGWPSFVKPLDSRHVTFHEDRSEGSIRVEVRSRYADSHLGHVFTDGPPERGGMRFCINSASLRFIPVSKLEKEGFEEFAKAFQK